MIKATSTISFTLTFLVKLFELLYSVSSRASMAEIDVNAFTTPFQLVKGLHRDVYPAIEPSNPALSAAGKAVLVTGAGGAIGAVRKPYPYLPVTFH